MFVGGNLVRLAHPAQHILVDAAFIHIRRDADLVHEAAIIQPFHDDANAGGEGQVVRDDPAARRGNVITAARRQAAHRADHRFSIGAALKFREQFVDLIRRHDFAARRIHLQDDGFDAGIVLRAVQLRLDHVHHAVARRVGFVAGDDAVHLDDGDFGARVVVFQHAFLQLRADVASGAGFEAAIEAAANRVRNGLRKISQQAESQQHEQDDGENHPAPSPARLGRRRRRDHRRRRE